MKPELYCFSLFSFFTFSLCDTSLPTDVIIQPVSCSSDDDCPSFFYPYCDPVTNKCTHTCQNSDCDRFSGAGLGSCISQRCYVTCTALDDPICLSMRAYCGLTSSIVRCYQCGADSSCQNAGYGADSYCDKTTVSGFGACSSCPKTGCTVGTCQNYKCVECSDDNYCLTNEPDTPYCEQTFSGNYCRECYDISHCTNPSASYCTSNTCQPCAEDSQCTHLDGKNKCSAGVCVTYADQCPSEYGNIAVSQTSNSFTIKFPSAVVSYVDVKTSLGVALVNIPISQYTYTISQVSTTRFLLAFTFGETIPATKLKLTLPCPTPSGYLYGSGISVQFNTEKVLYTTPAVEEMVGAIKSVASAATTAMISVSGSMMFAGANPAILWALINLLQAFYYLAFINVEYPANVEPFLKLFTMGNLIFIPNPIGWFFSNIDNESLDAPQRFLDNDVDGLFFQTAGNMLLLWFVVFVSYLTSFLFLRYTRNMPRILNVIAIKIVEIFEWSGVFRTLITSYTQLTMTALLQMRVLTYSSSLFVFSSIFGIIFAALALVVPAITWLAIHKYHQKTRIMERKFGTLTEGLQTDSTAHPTIKYFSLFFLGRRFILALTLVFLHNYPYLEISVLLVSCIFWTLLLLKYCPYKERLDNIINISSEIVFTVIHIFIFLLIYADGSNWLSDQERLTLGWGIVGGCGAILVVSLISSFIQQYSTLKKFLLLVKKAILKGKEAKNKKLKLMQRRVKRLERLERVKIGEDGGESHNSSIWQSLSDETSVGRMKLEILSLTAGNSRRMRNLKRVKR